MSQMSQSLNQDIPAWVLKSKQKLQQRPKCLKRLRVQKLKQQTFRVQLLSQSIYGYQKVYQIRWLWFYFCINLHVRPINLKKNQQLRKSKYFILQGNTYLIQQTKIQNQQVLLLYHLRQFVNQLTFSLFLSKFQLFQTNLQIFLLYFQQTNKHSYISYKVCQVQRQKKQQICRFITQLSIKMSQITFFNRQNLSIICLQNICFQNQDVLKHNFLIQGQKQNVKKKYLINSKQLKLLANYLQYKYQNQSIFYTDQFSFDFKSNNQFISCQRSIENTQIFFYQNFSLDIEDLKVENYQFVKCYLDQIFSEIFANKKVPDQYFQKQILNFNKILAKIKQNNIQLGFQNSSLVSQIKKVIQLFEKQLKQNFEQQQLQKFNLDEEDLNLKLKYSPNAQDITFYKIIKYQIDLLDNSDNVILIPIFLKVYRSLFADNNQSLFADSNRSLFVDSKHKLIQRTSLFDKIKLWKISIDFIAQTPMFLSFKLIKLLTSQIISQKGNIYNFKQQKTHNIIFFCEQSIKLLYQLHQHFDFSGFQIDKIQKFFNENQSSLIMNLVAISFKFLPICKVQNILQQISDFIKKISFNQFKLEEMNKLSFQEELYLQANHRRIKLFLIDFLIKTILVVNSLSMQKKIQFYYQNQPTFRSIELCRQNLIKQNIELQVLWFLLSKCFVVMLIKQINDFCFNFLHINDSQSNQNYCLKKEELLKEYQNIQEKIKKQDKSISYFKTSYNYIIKSYSYDNQNNESSTNYSLKKDILTKKLFGKNTNEYVFEDLEQFENLNTIIQFMPSSSHYYKQQIKFKIFKLYLRQLITHVPNLFQEKYTLQSKYQINQNLKLSAFQIQSQSSLQILIAIKFHVSVFVSILAYINDYKIRLRTYELLNQMIRKICLQNRDNFLFFMQNLGQELCHCLKMRQIRIDTLLPLIEKYRQHLISLKQQVQYKKTDFFNSIQALIIKIQFCGHNILVSREQMKKYYFYKIFIKYTFLSIISSYLKQEQLNQGLLENIKAMNFEIKSQLIGRKLKNVIFLQTNKFIYPQKIMFFENCKMKNSLLNISCSFLFQSNGQFQYGFAGLIKWIKNASIKVIYQSSLFICSVIVQKLLVALQNDKQKQKIVDLIKGGKTVSEIHVYIQLLHFLTTNNIGIVQKLFLNRICLVLEHSIYNLKDQLYKRYFCQRLIFFQLFLIKNKNPRRNCKLIQKHLKNNYKNISVSQLQKLYYHNLHQCYSSIKNKTMTLIYQSKCFKCYAQAFNGNIFQSKIYKNIQKFYNNLYLKKNYLKKQRKKRKVIILKKK